MYMWIDSYIVWEALPQTRLFVKLGGLDSPPHHQPFPNPYSLWSHFGEG